FDGVHRLAHADFRGEMHDAVDALERVCHDVLVADVADDQLGVVGQVERPFSIPMHLLDQAIEHTNLVAASKELTCDSAANEPGATRHQYSFPAAQSLICHLFLRSEFKRY